MRLLLASTLSFSIALVLQAQLPVTKVFAFDYQQRDTSFTFTKPRYLSAFNPYGYNNQPAFIDDQVLLMAVQYPDMPQPDIFSLDLAKKEQTRVTRTLSGEYSPNSIGDGTYFSAIRQEYVGRDTIIRLWRFPSNRIDNGEPVFPYINGIAYHEWLSSRQLAVFLTGAVSKLALISVGSTNPIPIQENVGRTFRRLPNGNLAFVSKMPQTGGGWALMEMNLYRLSDPPRFLCATLPGQEDFTVLRDGSFLAGSGTKLYRFDPVNHPSWQEIVDFRFYGLRNISRLTTNNKGTLVIVAE